MTLLNSEYVKSIFNGLFFSADSTDIPENFKHLRVVVLCCRNEPMVSVYAILQPEIVASIERLLQIRHKFIENSNPDVFAVSGNEPRHIHGKTAFQLISNKNDLKNITARTIRKVASMNSIFESDLRKKKL